MPEEFRHVPRDDFFDSLLITHDSSLLRTFGDEISHFLIKLLGVGAVLFGVQTVDASLSGLGEEAFRVVLGYSTVITESRVQATFTLGGIVTYGNSDQSFFRLGGPHKSLRRQHRIIGSIPNQVRIQLPRPLYLQNG